MKSVALSPITIAKKKNNEIDGLVERRFRSELAVGVFQSIQLNYRRSPGPSTKKD